MNKWHFSEISYINKSYSWFHCHPVQRVLFWKRYHQVPPAGYISEKKDDTYYIDLDYQVSGNQEREGDRPVPLLSWWYLHPYHQRKALGKHTTAFWKTLPQSGLLTRIWRDGWWLSKNQHSQVNSKPGYTRMASYPAFCGHCWYMNSHCQLWRALKWGSTGTLEGG